MKTILSGICAMALLGLAGCSQQDKVEASNQAQRAGSEIRQAAAEAQKDLSDGSITLRVKTAMQASSKLDTGDINVDTKDKVVHLKGTVPSAEQKALAERIAHDTVGENIQVMSHLAVKPEAAAK